MLSIIIPDHTGYFMRSFLVVIALLASSSLPAEPDGANLYARHCAGCHGYQGKGGVGVPLALVDFQYAVSDQYLRRTIRLGRPGRVMPAFDDLNDADIDAIVRHIRSWAPGKPIKHPTHRVAGDVANGQRLYQQHCTSCHGSKGEGGKGTGVTFSRPRDLPIIAPALNNSGFLAAASDQMIKATLMNGREGTPMVSFRKLGLTEQQIDDIVSYIRSFESQPDPNAVGKHDNEPLTIVYDSPHSLQKTVELIQRAAVGKNFRLIRVQNLDDGLVKPEQENKQQVIVYFCNFKLLNDALSIDPRVGLFLPCRVTAIEVDGQVQVITINPKRLAAMFNNAELNRLCDEMTNTYTEILEEATL